MTLAFCGEFQPRRQQATFELLIQLEMENFGLLFLFLFVILHKICIYIKMCCICFLCWVHMIGVSSGQCAWHARESQRTASRGRLSPSSQI